jgi:hypothetical protein
MIERPYRVELGDHERTIVRRDAEEGEADAAARRLSRRHPKIRVHVVHRDTGIVRSFEAGARVSRS